MSSLGPAVVCSRSGLPPPRVSVSLSSGSCADCVVLFQAAMLLGMCLLP